ncbi:MAG TPA: hydrogenase maturation protease [Acidimicrobiales bacterium]|nr:hydrogenase maturation protease [Acidimicrobiales bacterium]
MSSDVRDRPRGGPPPRHRPSVVVAGLGNEYRRDDGAGPAAAARVVSLVTARDVGPVVDPLDLLGRWDGADLAVVIDAIRSGSAPGTVRIVDLETAVDDHGATSTHGISLSGVWRLAQAVGRAPARVIVVGIEGADFGSGPGLSPAVDAAVPEAVSRVVDLIKEVNPCA